MTLTIDVNKTQFCLFLINEDPKQLGRLIKKIEVFSI